MKIQTSLKRTTISMQFITLLALILCFGSFGKAQNTDSINYLHEGDPIPEFTIPLEDGSTISSSKLKGKTLVLSFFATWCGPCLRELPHVQTEIWEKYQTNKNFELFVIGREHTSEEMAKFKTDKAYTFPIVADTKREIFSLFAKQNIPRMYLIDRTGKIILMSEGFEQSKFNAFLKRLDDELKK